MKDRAKSMICVSCIHFVSKTESIGRCRKHAPTLNGWPAVYITDWCGDYKIDENMSFNNISVGEPAVERLRNEAECI